MGAAAELSGPALNINNTDDLAVLLAEQSHSAHLLGFLDGQVLDGDGQSLVNLLVDAALDLGQLGGGDGAEMRKVEVGDLVVLIAAGLMDMLAQDLAQGLLQQVGGSVVAADGGTALLIDGSGDLVVNVDGAVQQLTGMDEIAFGVFLTCVTFSLASPLTR